MTWTSSVCEFETTAFGGPHGLAVACDLFHADSRHILHRPTASPMSGRRETSILLCGALLRGAGLDWFETGDVWARVRDLRPRENNIPEDPARARRLRDAMRTLMTADAWALSATAASGPLSGQGTWVAAFENAGRDLARIDRQGRLERGLRAVLAHHLIFHFNRAGIAGTDQATIAALAVDVVFNNPGPIQDGHARAGPDP
jgi:protein-L-isoaspartate(D-aspartate) O-methyltransferase